VNNATSEKFIELFTRSQRKLYLFILAQVASAADAEEILQETNLVIWSKCDQFEEGTNFFAWAAAIANFEVLRFRQRRQRDKHTFSQEFVEGIALEVVKQLDHTEDRQLALEACLKQLSADDMELIRKRYQPGESGRSVAGQIGRPANSVYQSLGRIRRFLMECVRKRMALGQA
jgi:RNA polymerase sigma-70 factor, ECF subfamily